MTDIKVPAHIAKRIEARRATATTSAIADALAGFSTPPRISTRASRFRLVENSVETVIGTELDVIIVGANPNTSKVFFADEYDPDAGEVRPDCSSADGKTPDANIANPVCSSCAQCSNNVLGSKITQKGSKSKLCGDVRYLAVVPAADPSKVYSLNIAVMSMKPLRMYVQSLGNYGIVPEEVVTTLGFDDDASYPLLTFTQGKFLPAVAIAAIEQIQATPEVASATRTDTQAAALPAPAVGTTGEPEQAGKVAQIEDARPKAAPKKATPRKAAAKKVAPEEAVVAESEEQLTELEAALGDIFG
ncbi:MAG: hypothetical protein BMS9Abin11_1849 [Gammaproteobacteria bacterium]|nr:MAG: hypothetical protein BMS9Abin11_1849 [Gammaproteobacteria bacterium]